MSLLIALILITHFKLGHGWVIASIIVYILHLVRDSK